MSGYGIITVKTDTKALVDKILRRYPTRYSEIRELIQNADDASSKKVTLIINKQENVILFRNNGHIFNETDWKRLTTIASGNANSESIGCFGVGFFTVFSITDTPVVQSGGIESSFFWENRELKCNKRPMEEKNEWTTFLFKNIKKMIFEEWDKIGLIQFLIQSIAFTRNIIEVEFIFNQEIFFFHKIIEKVNTIEMNTQNKPLFTKEGKNLNFTGEKFEINLVTIKATSTECVKDASGQMKQERKEEILGRFTQVIGSYLVHYSPYLFAELTNLSLKEPPKRARISLLMHDITHDSPLHPFIRSLSPSNCNGKIFIGFTTQQTTGTDFHISGQFITTIERENLDFNHSIATEWNEYLLSAAGALSFYYFMIFTGQLRKHLFNQPNQTIIDQKPFFKINKHSSGAENNHMIDYIISNYSKLISIYSFNPSRPSSRVSTILETSFYYYTTEPILLPLLFNQHSPSSNQLESYITIDDARSSVLSPKWINNPLKSNLTSLHPHSPIPSTTVTQINLHKMEYLLFVRKLILPSILIKPGAPVGMDSPKQSLSPAKSSAESSNFINSLVRKYELKELQEETFFEGLRSVSYFQEQDIIELLHWFYYYIKTIIPNKLAHLQQNDRMSKLTKIRAVFFDSIKYKLSISKQHASYPFLMGRLASPAGEAGMVITMNEVKFYNNKYNMQMPKYQAIPFPMNVMLPSTITIEFSETILENIFAYKPFLFQHWWEYFSTLNPEEIESLFATHYRNNLYDLMEFISTNYYELADVRAKTALLTLLASLKCCPTTDGRILKASECYFNDVNILKDKLPICLFDAMKLPIRKEFLKDIGVNESISSSSIINFIRDNQLSWDIQAFAAYFQESYSKQNHWNPEDIKYLQNLPFLQAKNIPGSFSVSQLFYQEANSNDHKLELIGFPIFILPVSKPSPLHFLLDTLGMKKKPTLQQLVNQLNQILTSKNTFQLLSHYANVPPAAGSPNANQLFPRETMYMFEYLLENLHHYEPELNVNKNLPFIPCCIKTGRASSGRGTAQFQLCSLNECYQEENPFGFPTVHEIFTKYSEKLKVQKSPEINIIISFIKAQVKLAANRSLSAGTARIFMDYLYNRFCTNPNDFNDAHWKEISHLPLISVCLPNETDTIQLTGKECFIGSGYNAKYFGLLNILPCDDANMKIFQIKLGCQDNPPTVDQLIAHLSNHFYRDRYFRLNHIQQGEVIHEGSHFNQYVALVKEIALAFLKNCQTLAYSSAVLEQLRNYCFYPCLAYRRAANVPGKWEQYCELRPIADITFFDHEISTIENCYFQEDFHFAPQDKEIERLYEWLGALSISKLLHKTTTPVGQQQRRFKMEEIIKQRGYLIMHGFLDYQSNLIASAHAYLDNVQVNYVDKIVREVRYKNKMHTDDNCEYYATVNAPSLSPARVPAPGSPAGREMERKCESVIYLSRKCTHSDWMEIAKGIYDILSSKEKPAPHYLVHGIYLVLEKDLGYLLSKNFPVQRAKELNANLLKTPVNQLKMDATLVNPLKKQSSDQVEGIMAAGSPDYPARRSQMTKPFLTCYLNERKMVKQAMQIKCGSSHLSPSGHPPPVIAEEDSRCFAEDPVALTKLVNTFTIDLGEHQNVKCFASEKTLNDTKEALATHENALGHFCAYLNVLKNSVFRQTTVKTNIFYDKSIAIIALNTNGILFFNAAYYLDVHVLPAAPPQEVKTYWYLTFCHELAHNLVGPHNASFANFLATIICESLPSFITHCLFD